LLIPVRRDARIGSEIENAMTRIRPEKNPNFDSAIFQSQISKNFSKIFFSIVISILQRFFPRFATLDGSEPGGAVLTSNRFREFPASENLKRQRPGPKSWPFFF
jgi:hypothetical protein